jgi:hypothetical protein
VSELHTGWLSPTGELIQCGSFEHLAYARKIAKRFGYDENRPDGPRHLDDVLLFAGWMKISISNLIQTAWAINWNRILTPEQIRFIRPYFEDNKRPVSFGTMCQWEKEVLEKEAADGQGKA